MISVENVSKGFGGRTLLDGISMQLNSRERIGLVGRNGHGKTTLFNIISGQILPDTGQVRIPRNYRIAYVTQHLDFSAPTVLQEGMASLPPHEEGHHWKVEKILAGLGFSPDGMQQAPETFSGGYQVRLNLAKALISEPDLLLLDEPTNYLDIGAIRWVERFLIQWPHELMVISHDRSFMDTLATHIVGIHRRKLRKIAGNTEKYYDQIAQEEAVYENTRLNDEKKRREIEQFINRFRAKARLANLVQSRIKTLSKMEKRDKLEKARSLEFRIESLPFRGRHLMTVEDMMFAYPDRQPIVSGFDLSLNRGDRVGIIGKNGRGKTTLLKLLAGALTAQEGSRLLNPNVTCGLFEQTHTASLADTRTVEEEILSVDPSMGRTRARNICGTMLFSGENALKPIAVLSGGEKSRVMLGKILATPVNLLLLDEPTNHLDMDACDALLSALDDFEGTLVMVTHNEMFLHALAQRLIVFQGGRIEVFEDGYQAFLEQIGWQDEGGPQGGAPRQVSQGSKDGKKELRRKRSKIVKARSKQLKPLKKKIDLLEETIADLESGLAGFHHDMVQASNEQDAQEIQRLSQCIHRQQEAIDQNYEDLESLSIQYDEKEADFQHRLAQIEAE